MEASGGTLVSTDGTYPLRVVFRCLVRPMSHMWIQGGGAHGLWKPEDTFITHMQLYAVAANLCHEHHVQEDEPYEVPNCSRRFTDAHKVG